jgi:hypothetical protein
MAAEEAASGVESAGDAAVCEPVVSEELARGWWNRPALRA